MKQYTSTTEEMQQLPTETEVIHTDTDLKNATNLEWSGQASQTKDEIVIDLTTDITEKRYQQDSELQFGLNIQVADGSDSELEIVFPLSPFMK